MSKEDDTNEEIEFGPCLGGGLVPYLRWQGGKVVEAGVGQRGGIPELGGRAVTHGPEKENGRRDVRSTFTINARGSVCHSGTNSRQYLDGWDRIFAARRKPNGKAN